MTRQCLEYRYHLFKVEQWSVGLFGLGARFTHA